MSLPTGRDPRPLREVQEARWAWQILAPLGRQPAVPHDISTRLRFAREQAVIRHEQRATAWQIQTQRAGAGLVWQALGWHIASALPGLVLALGLLTIQHWQDRLQVQQIAEVDTALLIDDLPPEAYADPGFAQYLISPVEP